MPHDTPPPVCLAQRPRRALPTALPTALMVALLAAPIGGALGCDDSASMSAPATDGSADGPPLDRDLPEAGPLDGSPMDRGPVDGPPDDPPRADAALDPTPDAAADAGVDPRAVPLAGQSPWGPAARIHRLDVPPDANTGRRAGCLLHGSGVGSRLYSLLLLAGGGLSTQVRPDGAGRIDLVLLMRIRGWEPGLSAGALDRIDVELLPGAQGPDRELLYRPEAFIDGDPEAGAVTVFPDTGVDDGWLETDAVTLTVPLSLLNSPELPLILDNTTLVGRIAAEGPGWRLTDAALAGYITVERVGVLVEVLREQCLAEDAPTFCNLIAGQLDQSTEELIDLMVGFVGGLEARVEGPRVTPCDPEVPDDCNALGICLIVQAEPAVVEGVGPAAQ